MQIRRCNVAVLHHGFGNWVSKRFQNRRRRSGLIDWYRACDRPGRRSPHDTVSRVYKAQEGSA